MKHPVDIIKLIQLIFSKHQNKIIFVIELINSRSRMTLKSSVAIFRTLKTSAASLTSAASATSLVSTDSTALFSQKTSWSWWFDHQWHQNDQYQTFCMEWIDIWYLFCQRLLRPAYVIFLKTGQWNSNFQTSGIYRYLQAKSNLHIPICQSHFKRNSSMWNTLYLNFHR